MTPATNPTGTPTPPATRTRKIDPDELRRFLEAGHSQADAARHFGTSQAAISQRVAKLRIATSKVIALERAGEVVDQKLQATERLARVQRVIDEELRWAVDQTKSVPERLTRELSSASLRRSLVLYVRSEEEHVRHIDQPSETAVSQAVV